MNFTKKGLTDSANTVMKLIDLRGELESKSDGKMADVDLSHPVLNEFATALADDLNIAGALAVMHTWIKSDHSDPALSLAIWDKMNSVLAIAPVGGEGVGDADGGGADDEGEAMRLEMVAAREAKDYAKSDELRDKLIAAGYDVQIGKTEVTIKKKLA